MRKSIFERKRRTKKAVVFSLDSLIALMITGVIIGSSFFYLSQVESVSWSQPGLQTINYDTLNILHVDKTFMKSVRYDDYTNVTEFVDNLFPDYICANMTFYDGSDSEIKSVQKSGCAYPKDNAKDIYVARRTFVNNYRIYYVVLQSWYD